MQRNRGNCIEHIIKPDREDQGTPLEVSAAPRKDSLNDEHRNTTIVRCELDSLVSSFLQLQLHTSWSGIEATTQVQGRRALGKLGSDSGELPCPWRWPRSSSFGRMHDLGISQFGNDFELFIARILFRPGGKTYRKGCERGQYGSVHRRTFLRPSPDRCRNPPRIPQMPLAHRA